MLPGNWHANTLFLNSDPVHLHDSRAPEQNNHEEEDPKQIERFSGEQEQESPQRANSGLPVQLHLYVDYYGVQV